MTDPLLVVAITALAVAMDAVAVSISSGMSRGSRVAWGDAFKMAGVFGAFQALMPALGYVGGALFRDAIDAWAHWVAFAILAVVGGHMAFESLHGGPDASQDRSDPFAWRRLLVLGVATSLDAAAVGLTLALVDLPLAASVTIIGATTFVLCIPAVVLGRRLGETFAHRAELAGGIVLILIGVNMVAGRLAQG